MSPLETVGVIVAVSLIACFVIPTMMFMVLKASSVGWYLGKYRAEEHIQRIKESPRGEDQGRA